MSENDSIIRFTSQQFKDFIMKNSRDYTAIVMINALERECEMCDNFYFEFEHVAVSWKLAERFSKRMFFVLIDID